jgi:hypothetical protein
VADEAIAGRTYARPHRVVGRGDLRDFLTSAVTASGGQVLFKSEAARAPLFVAAQVEEVGAFGLMCYVFRCNPPPIKGRAADEHRVQIRYGGQDRWDVDHPVGRDEAEVDTTLVLAAHPERELFIGLDPFLYDPLPMGISVEFKDADLEAIQRSTWHVWERDNVSGMRRPRRSASGLETLIGFTPERLLDYARFEHQAALLGLDPPLRFLAAEAVAAPRQADVQHVLEREFALSARDILDIIQERLRLSVAVRGGVAEHHLGDFLRTLPYVSDVERMEQDGPPDFTITMRAGARLTIECKNVSPKPYSDGGTKIEVQKTRASKGDPTGRLYKPDQFDVLAACLYPRTRQWEFRFIRSTELLMHDEHPGCIAPMQRVDERWSSWLPV